jgi:hypothetical protein
MAIDFKTDGMREFQEALQLYERLSSKTREQVLEHRGRNFAFALHSQAARVGRATKRRIQKVRASRMRVRGGDKRSKRQEKARRMFAAGFVAAGWLPAIKAFKTGGGVNTVADVDNPKGYVNKQYRRGFVEMVNAQPGAAAADEKWNISGKAVRGQERDMQRYFQRKADRDLGRAWR